MEILVLLISGFLAFFIADYVLTSKNKKKSEKIQDRRHNSKMLWAKNEIHRRNHLL